MIVYSVEVQAVLFAKYFLIFPPGACCLHFREAIQPRRIIIYTGGRRSRPPVPPWTLTTKNVGKGAKQISEHLGVARGALRPLHISILAKQMIFGKKQKPRLVSPQPAFYITDFVRSTSWLLFIFRLWKRIPRWPSWISF